MAKKKGERRKQCLVKHNLKSSLSDKPPKTLQYATQTLATNELRNQVQKTFTLNAMHYAKKPLYITGTSLSISSEIPNQLFAWLNATCM